MSQEVINELILSIVEEREEKMMFCNTDGSPTVAVRLARFLKPTAVSSYLTEVPPRPLVSKTKASSPFTVHFNGWKCPVNRWKEWVDQLKPKYGATWKKAGIYDSVIISTFQFQKNADLVLGLAECWCPDTNTFVFSWGEATLTLEDMFVLGGFSVLGQPVTCPLTEDLAKTEMKMIEVYKELARTAAHKVQHNPWINRFIGSNVGVEHAAFLSLWLSRFVFPTKPNGTISKQVFPVAIHLSEGTRIALAPAVLASLYRDLRVLKVQFNISSAKEPINKDDSSAIVYAPFQIMQLWAWERFPSSQPTPNFLSPGQPRAARWDKLTFNSKLDGVRAIIRSPDEYKWRPYSSVMANWGHPLYCQEQGNWVTVGPKMEEELFTFSRCLIPCELVGLCCIEQYGPNRVGRQFGMDQDIPGTFTRANANWKLAWRTYDSPITDIQLYIPPCHYKSGVSVNYFNWWNQSIPGSNNARKRSSSNSRVSIESSESDSSNNPPGYACKRSRQQQNLKDDDKMTISEWCSSPHASVMLENVAGSSCKKVACASSQGSSSSEVKTCHKKKPITKVPENIFVEEKDLSSKASTYTTSKMYDNGMFNTAGSVPPGFKTEARIRRLETVIDMLKEKFSSLKVRRQGVGSASHA